MAMFACRTILIFGAVWMALSLPWNLRAQQVPPPAEAAEVPVPPDTVAPEAAAPVPVAAVPVTPAPAGAPVEAAPALPVVAPIAATTPALGPPHAALATPYAALAPSYVGQGFSPAVAADAMSPAIAAAGVVPVVAESTPAPAAPLSQATTPPTPPAAPPPGAPSAQEEAPPPPPAAPPAGAPRATRPPQPPRAAIAAVAPGVGPYVAKDVNIRVDATITESRGEQTLGKKVITVTLRDGDTGSVRSSALVPQPKFGGTPDEQGLTRAPLNMDATVFLREGGRVLARVTLEYNRGSVELGNSGATQRAAFDSGIRQSVSVMLENGKPLVVAQSADPEGDRRVTLELKATVLK